MPETLPEPAKSSAFISKAEESSLGSNSRLAELYADPEFQLEWDNDLGFHLARHLVRLRKHRGLTQAELAERVGTSQPKVARIEGADENVTLRTIERLTNALDGRIRFGIEPAEIQIPHMPPWWDLCAHGLGVYTSQPWEGVRLAFRIASSAEPAVAVAAWTNAGLGAQPATAMVTATARVQFTTVTGGIGTRLVTGGPNAQG